MILGQMGGHPITEDDKELYETTLREATEKEWLEGPFGADEISRKFQDAWLPVRRFGVRQKNKLCPIDDMKENRLNESFTCNDKIDLKSLDQMLWSIFVLIRCCTFHGDVQFRLKSGEELRGRVDPTWKSQGADFRATSFDLESAYKLPLHPDEQGCSVVSIVDPLSNKIACFLMKTLPFGSIASVLHFNRVIRLIWRLGLQMGILWTNYFDDYPCVSHRLHEKPTMSAVRGLFELLGYAYGKDKLLDFSNEAEMLGIKLDLSESGSGVVVVDNKESRKGEMAEMLGEILKSKKVVPNELPSTLGILQYADMQVSGRTGKLAMCDIRALGYNGSKAVDLPPETCLAFEMLMRRLVLGKPKRFEVTVLERPIVISSDGAFERDDGGNPVAIIGGVFIFHHQEECGCLDATLMTRSFDRGLTSLNIQSDWLSYMEWRLLMFCGLDITTSGVSFSFATTGHHWTSSSRDRLTNRCGEKCCWLLRRAIVSLQRFLGLRESLQAATLQILRAGAPLIQFLS